MLIFNLKADKNLPRSCNHYHVLAGTKSSADVIMSADDLVPARTGLTLKTLI